MYPNAYVEYLLYFHGYRDYFECHEVLEEHWKQQPSGKRNQHWVGLIQIAVALYHYRRGNKLGAKRMFTSALRIIKTEQAALRALGLDSEMLSTLISDRIDELNSDHSQFSDMNLPIVDEKLLQFCKDSCQERGVTWLAPSDVANEYLIHKHKKRNRLDVIEERNLQLLRRKQQRNT